MQKVFESRPYQENIHKRAIEYLQKPRGEAIAKTLMIESPTGSGKTVMGLRLCHWLEQQGHKVGWIAHRKELLKQAMEANKQFPFELESLTPISLFNRNPAQFSDCTVVLVDEAQHDAAQSASILHEAIKPQIILGLTATPYRTDKAQLCFQKVIRDAGIHQLIREGYLAEFDQWVMEQEWTPENVARTYLEDPAKWGKSVIYFLTTVDALKCAAILKAAGIRAGSVLGSTKADIREQSLKDFKSGILQVITNVAVLTEGFDEPTLKTAFVRPSSRGPTVQMAGRAFRKYPGLPVVNIVQNQDSKYPFTRHARAHGQYIQEHGVWRSISLQNLEPIFAKQRIKVAGAICEMPEFLKKKAKQGRFGGFEESTMDV